MCFSATASFVAGGALTAAGIGTLTQAKKKERVALALIPLIFGLQQIAEGLVWISFGHYPLLHTFATYAVTLFSHVLWPFYVPMAVLLIERGPKRRKVLVWFVLVGVSVSIDLLYSVVRGPVTSVIVQNSLYYAVRYNHDTQLLLAVYILATCVSCWISSHKFIRMFGYALFGGLLISLLTYRLSFYSVWCFFAAILSGIIYVHLAQNPDETLVSKPSP